MLKGAIIGFGTIAQGHLKAYEKNQDIKIVAIVDSNKKRREIAKELGINIYQDIEQLLEKEKIDFVDVCTPPRERFNIMYKALEYKCHIIGEKPFVLTTEEYNILLNLQKKVNKVIYPIHNYKYAPAFMEAKKIIQTGEIGKIRGAHFRVLRKGHAKGVNEWKKDWRRMKEYSGGGIIEDHGPHSIYLAISIMDAFPEKISCIAGNIKKDCWKETEDTALLTLYFGEEREVDIDIIWASNERKTSYFFYGEKGTIKVVDDQVTILSEKRKKTFLIKSYFNDVLHSEWYISVIENFKTLLNNKEELQKLIRESYATIAIIEQAYKSKKRYGSIEDLNIFESVRRGV